MADVKYRFVHSGEQDVARAFRTIATAANDTARVQIRSARQTEQASVAAANRTVRATASAEARRWKEVEQAARRIEREYEREAAAARKAASDKTKAEDQASKARIKSIKAAEKEAERAAHEERRQLAQTWKERDKARKADQKEADRNAARARRDHERDQRAMARRERQLSQTARDRSTASPFAAVAATGIAGAMVGGAVLAASEIGAAARGANDLQEIANRLSINSRGAGTKAVDPATLRREMELTAMATPGIKSDDVGRAMLGFVSKTGDLDSARSMSQMMATMASASGTSIVDVSAMTANIREKFKIADPEEMKQALASIYMQGKAGAFELSDAAGTYDKLTAAGSMMGMTGSEGIKTLGGLAQIARSGTDSPAQASFAVEALLRQLSSKSVRGRINLRDDFGVKVFEDEGQTKARDIQSIIIEAMRGSKGNIPDLQEVFGDEGMKAIKPMLAVFNGAANALGKGATEAERLSAGESALRAMFDRSINVAGGWTDVIQDAAQAQQDNTAKFTAAGEMFQAKLSDSLLPVVDQLAESVGAATPVMDAFAGGVASAATVLADTIGELTRFGQNLGILDKGDSSAPVADRLAKAQGELDAIEGKALSGGELTQEQQLKRRVLKDKIVGLQQEFEQTWGYEATPDDLAAMSGRGAGGKMPASGSPSGSVGASFGKAALNVAMGQFMPGIGNVVNMAQTADGIPAGLRAYNDNFERNAAQLGQANTALAEFTANVSKASEASRPNVLGGKFQ